MLNEIISVFLQLIVFSLIPFIVYLVQYRKTYPSFWTFIGLKPSPTQANGLAALTSLIFILGAIGAIFFSENIKEIMMEPTSMTGKFRAMGFSASSVILILLTAWIKTGLSEEIFFRGFVAKRLIGLLGYQKGNLLQAVIFGALHIAIFLAMPGASILFSLFIFLFSGIGAYISCYLNEKMANGSIIPGWISHGLGNTLAYSIVAFLI